MNSPPLKAGRRKSALNQKKVFTAALRLANKHGVESVSMRRLAQALKVQAMSLYNHVKNKDELIDGIVDLVTSKFEVPLTESDWRKTMRHRAHRTHEVLLQHPWAALLLLSRVTVGPGMMSYSNATIGCLIEAGFSYEMADHACNALDNHIYGFTLQEINSPVNPADYAAAAAHYLPDISALEYPYIHSMATLVMQGSHSGINNFDFGLELILDGLEKLRGDQRHNGFLTAPGHTD